MSVVLLHEGGLCLSFTVLEAQMRSAEVLKPTVCGIKINEICLPGNTLLWDLLQDENIVCSTLVAHVDFVCTTAT